MKFGYGVIEDNPETFPEAGEPLAKLRGRTWRTDLTHGDLGPHNILWNVKVKRVTVIQYDGERVMRGRRYLVFQHSTQVAFM